MQTSLKSKPADSLEILMSCSQICEYSPWNFLKQMKFYARKKIPIKIMLFYQASAITF